MNKINDCLSNICEYYGVDVFISVFKSYVIEFINITNNITNGINSGIALDDDLKCQAFIKLIDLELTLDVIKSNFIDDDNKFIEIYNEKISDLMEEIK